MVSCAACGTSNSQAKHLKITFHSFPKNPVQRKAWLDFIHRDERTVVKWFLCSLHFKEDDFDRTSNVKVRLKENVIPTKIVRRMKYYHKQMDMEIIDTNDSAPIPETIQFDSSIKPCSPPNCEDDEEIIIKVENEEVPTSHSEDLELLISETTLPTSENVFNQLQSHIHLLEAKVRQLQYENINKSKKKISLQQKNWRQTQKILQLARKVEKLSQENIIS